jgi:HEAT repeat protein
VKILKKLALDPAREVRLVAIDVLAEEPDKHLELIRKWAKDDDQKVRETVARHLHLTDQPRKILPILEQLALDPDSDVHWTAAATLYDIYSIDPKGALEVAKKMAANPDMDLRSAAALCFFEHVFADSFDHSFLLMRQWVRSGDPNLRWTLAHSLRFAKATARSFQVLRALFEDRDPEIRRRVVWQLAEFFKKFEDPRQAAELMRRALRDQSKRVRDVAEESEKNLGIDLATIAPPPVEGEPGAEVQEPWGPIEEVEQPAEEAKGEGEGEEEDEDDDF